MLSSLALTVALLAPPAVVDEATPWLRGHCADPAQTQTCSNVRAFLAAAPSVLVHARQEVERLTGRPAEAPVTFFVDPEAPDGQTDVSGNVRLNAAAETFTRTRGLVVTVTHELWHADQKRTHAKALADLSPVVRALYTEGGACYGAWRVFPEVGDGATGVPAEDRTLAALKAPQAAQALLKAWREPAVEAEALLNAYPRKMLYFLGFRLFQAFARTTTPEAAARATPAQFSAFAEIELRELASGSRFGTPPEVDPNVLRDRFLARAAKAGFTLGFVPEMREWTRPSLISWRAEARAVALPRWEEVPEPTKRLFVEWTGGDPDAAVRMFHWLFRWFLIPHELMHAFQERVPMRSHAFSERVANDIAAELLAEGTDHGLIQALHRGLAGVRLEPPPIPDEVFDAEYDRLAQDPRRYGTWQLATIRRSTANWPRVDTTFDRSMRRALDPK